MQNCEETETNLQVMIKGNQIKNFSKERLKTSHTRLQHTQAVEKDVAKCKSKLIEQANKWTKKLNGLARLSGCNLR